MIVVSIETSSMDDSSSSTIGNGGAGHTTSMANVTNGSTLTGVSSAIVWRNLRLEYAVDAPIDLVLGRESFDR